MNKTTYEMKRSTKEGHSYSLDVIAYYNDKVRIEVYIKDEFIVGAIWGLLPLLSYPASVQILEKDITFKPDLSIIAKFEDTLSKTKLWPKRTNVHTGVAYFKSKDGLYVDDAGRRYYNASEHGWLFGLPNYSSGQVTSYDYQPIEIGELLK